MDIGKEQKEVIVQPVKLPYPLTKREKAPSTPEPVKKEPVKEPALV